MQIDFEINVMKITSAQSPLYLSVSRFAYHLPFEVFTCYM